MNSTPSEPCAPCTHVPEPASQPGPRLLCYRCEKPQSMCLCAQIVAVDNRTSVFVLQHPRERTHPIGTARLARLGLRDVRVEVAWKASARETEPPPWLPPDTALLYPTPGARELSALPLSERPQRLLVLDGTWNTARSLYRDKLWLQRMPHVHFVPAAESRYRLRKQPAVQCVSTIEAIVEALRVLEPQTAGLNELLTAFDAMIEAQLAHVQRRAGRLHTRKRRPVEQRRIPEALVHDFARLVIVYVESARESRSAERELVQLSAQALQSDATLQHTVASRSGLPSAKLLGHMQLDAIDFADAISTLDLRHRFGDFLARHAPDPIIVAWNESTLDLLRAAGLALPRTLALKSAYRARYGTAQATLEDVVEAHRLPAQPNALRGRAARRIAFTAAVARHLHRLL